MNKLKILSGSVVFAGLLLGCNFHARGPEDYKKDTRALLRTREAQIKSCYDQLLKEDKKAGGKIVLTFTIEKGTGAFSHVSIKDKDSSDSEPLQKCVLDAVAGLKLDPPDERDGKATFVYEFKQK